MPKANGYPTLFELFLVEELTPGVRILLRELVSAQRQRPGQRASIELNRFIVAIDPSGSIVEVEDLLDPPGTAGQIVPMQEFLDRVGLGRAI